MSILDPKWRYAPSTATNIGATLRKHGFKPTTEKERAARQRGVADSPVRRVLSDVPRRNIVAVPPSRWIKK
jgi:hypothetical protein